MHHPAEYREPLIDTFEEVEVLGDQPDQTMTLAAGSNLPIHSS